MAATSPCSPKATLPAFFVGQDGGAQGEPRVPLQLTLSNIKGAKTPSTALRNGAARVPQSALKAIGNTQLCFAGGVKHFECVACCGWRGVLRMLLACLCKHTWLARVVVRVAALRTQGAPPAAVTAVLRGSRSSASPAPAHAQPLLQLCTQLHLCVRQPARMPLPHPEATATPPHVQAV